MKPALFIDSWPGVSALTTALKEKASLAKAEKSIVPGYKHKYLEGSLTTCPCSNKPSACVCELHSHELLTRFVVSGIWLTCQLVLVGYTKEATVRRILSWSSAWQSHDSPSCGAGLRSSQKAARYPFTVMPLLQAAVLSRRSAACIVHSWAGLLIAFLPVLLVITGNKALVAF